MTDRAGEVGIVTVSDVFVKITADMSRFDHAMRSLNTTMVHIRLRLDGGATRRPDGRLRRGGHRHRGTRGWRRRYYSRAMWTEGFLRGRPHDAPVRRAHDQRGPVAGRAMNMEGNVTRRRFENMAHPTSPRAGYPWPTQRRSRVRYALSVFAQVAVLVLLIVAILAGGAVMGAMLGMDMRIAP